MLPAVRWLPLVVACAPPHDPAVPQVVPACQAGLADGHLTIGNAPTAIAVDDASAHAVTYPSPRPGHILMSWALDPEADQPPSGSTDIHDVDCTTRAVTPLAHYDSADFGHGAVDGRTLYFTDLGGVGALDVATGQVRAITRAPATTCDGSVLDVVVALHDGALDLHRFDCGAAGQDFVLDHAAAGGEPRAVHPIASLAVEAGGAVWAGGMPCRSPQLWRSIDHGEHWKAIALPEEAGGPIAIIADKARVGLVVVETASCIEPPAVIGGRLYITRDLGRDWELIAPPDDATLVEDGTAQHLSVASRDGTIDSLAISADTIDGSDALATWVSDDAGKTWIRMGKAQPAPAAPAEVRDGAWAYRPSPDGVLRTRAGRGLPVGRPP
jgi:hypothetical protein